MNNFFKIVNVWTVTPVLVGVGVWAAAKSLPKDESIPQVENKE